MNSKLIVITYNSPIRKKVMGKMPTLDQKAMLVNQEMIKDPVEERQSIIGVIPINTICN